MPRLFVRRPSSRLAERELTHLDRVPVDAALALAQWCAYVEVFPVFAGVAEEHGTAMVVLDDETVLMSADAPATAAEHCARGLEVVSVDVSEFEKLEGCVTCLSVRVRD